MKRFKIAIAAAAAAALTGCYVVQQPDGSYWTVIPGQPQPGTQGGAQPPGPPQPVALNVRMYPENDIATRTGVVTGTVINMMNGKGRFQLNYAGETLTGEATSVDGDSRRGVASAFGQNGAYMSCEYQMRSARQGAGTCTMSNGAKYQIHIGS